jgi:phosphotransacetylase
MLTGLEHAVQIATLGSKDADIVNLAALAAYDLGR